ncbi:Trehalose-phosphatase [Trichinella pseudospiralis]
MCRRACVMPSDVGRRNNMKVSVRMVCLAAYTDNGEESGIRDTESLDCVLKWQLRVTWLTREQWELTMMVMFARLTPHDFIQRSRWTTERAVKRSLLELFVGPSCQDSTCKQTSVDLVRGQRFCLKLLPKSVLWERT